MPASVASRFSLRFLPLLLLLAASPSFGGEVPSVDIFSPQGTAKKVRQATARFTEAMVPFGDPRLSDPFAVSCTGGVKGRGRWADGRNWAYDFEEDLPSGIWCTFTLKPGLKSLSGAPVGGRRGFSFTTGGPAIVLSVPYDGDDQIDENQAFLLLLDALADEKSVLAYAQFSVGGVNEAVGARIVKGKEREALIEAGPARMWRKRNASADPRILVLAPAQAFPPGAKVVLWWGAGVRTAGGVAGEETRKMTFRARPAFTVNFRCDRERKGGDCLPILPMRLDFSALVDRSLASKIVLREADGTTRAPVLPEDMPGDPYVSGAVFEGPFPEKSRFHVEIPAELADDAGRSPANRDKFPLAVATGVFPPLAKFPAPFGIVELRGDAALPLTVRNIEAQATGRIYELREGREERIVDWLRKVDRAEERREGRSIPLLADMKEAAEFAVPKPGGEKAFEVVGIPFARPGFYVVEIGSERLGKSLLDGKGTMYVAAAALVTNLSAHLKLGRESSLVWVTSLDRGEPVEGADVAVRDPMGKALWEGKTDADGVARIRKALPEAGHPEGCSPYCGLYATARKGDDLTFVFSEWREGIEPYRFRVPTSYRADPAIAHTVFDRTLFQAGETVRMKHFLRRHAMDGLFTVGEGLPATVLLRHEGSGQRFEMPLAWAADGSAASEWAIPKEAKLGVYGVFLREKAPAAKGARTAVGGYPEGDEEYGHMGRGDRYAGSFRVEEYRVPLM
ncbi:MAG: alpha-2-macroglobulin, partial [Deltaproteobacteria bacterium]|nr:alpha-2-macroglobulin [Deltaproteobacteria bacterium]